MEAISYSVNSYHISPLYLLGYSDDVDGTASHTVFHHDPKIIVFVVGAIEFHNVLTAAISKDDDLG